MSTASAVDPGLLAVLRCPESLQPLRMADEEMVRRLRQQARQGTLKNIRDSRVEDDFEAVLVRQDGKRAYLIRDGIPVMLVDDALAL